MTISEIKSELNKARDSVRDYRLAQDKANAYRQLLISGGTVRYNSDGSTRERNGNPVECAYCCLADYEAELNSAAAEMIRCRKKPKTSLHRLTTERSVKSLHGGT